MTSEVISENTIPEITISMVDITTKVEDHQSSEDGHNSEKLSSTSDDSTNDDFDDSSNVRSNSVDSSISFTSPTPSPSFISPLVSATEEDIDYLTNYDSYEGKESFDDNPSDSSDNSIIINHNNPDADSSQNTKNNDNTNRNESDNNHTTTLVEPNGLEKNENLKRGILQSDNYGSTNYFKICTHLKSIQLKDKYISKLAFDSIDNVLWAALSNNSISYFPISEV